MTMPGPAAGVCAIRTSKYMGVGSRGDRYHSELRIPEWGNTKIWGGTYPTVEGAARAWDTSVFYTRREHPYNFPDSLSYIEKFCESREQAPLQFEELRKFIRTQAARLVDAIAKETAEGHRTDGLSERVGDGSPTLLDICSSPHVPRLSSTRDEIGLLHHSPETSFRQGENDLLHHPPEPSSRQEENDLWDYATELTGSQEEFGLICRSPGLPFSQDMLHLPRVTSLNDEEFNWVHLAQHLSSGQEEFGLPCLSPEPSFMRDVPEHSSSQEGFDLLHNYPEASLFQEENDSLHHVPETSFSQEEIDLLYEVLSDRADRDALSPNRSLLFNSEDQRQTASRLEDIERWVDSLVSQSHPVESIMAGMQKDGGTREEVDDHPRDYQKVFLLRVAKDIASVLHALQLRDPRAWYDLLAMLILAFVGQIVKIDFPSDAHKGQNSGSLKDMLVDENHNGGKRMALHNLKSKGTETVVADKLELHGKAAGGIDSFKTMTCNLEILTLLESLRHGDLVGQTVASGLLSVISSANEKRLLIAELAIPLLIEKLKDSTLLVRSYVATTLCNVGGASNCNLFDKDDANSQFKTPGAIAGIIDLLQSGDIITGRLSAAELLWRLSQNIVNRVRIGECDAIPILIDCLSESQNGVRQYCLGTLCNLSELPNYRSNIRIHKPVVAFANIVRSGCPQEKQDASKIIENLARNFDGLNHEARNELTATLIDSVQHGDPQGDRVTAIACLRWLCEDMSATFESTVIPLAVVPFLIGKLRNGYGSGKSSAARCLWILGQYQTVSKSIYEYGVFPLLYAFLLEDDESDRGRHSSGHVDDNMIEGVPIPADTLYWNATLDGTLPVEQW